MTRSLGRWAMVVLVATVVIVEAAGHTSRSPGMREALLQATRSYE